MAQNLAKPRLETEEEAIKADEAMKYWQNLGDHLGLRLHAWTWKRRASFVDKERGMSGDTIQIESLLAERILRLLGDA